MELINQDKFKFDLMVAPDGGSGAVKLIQGNMNVYTRWESIS